MRWVKWCVVSVVLLLCIVPVHAQQVGDVTISGTPEQIIWTVDDAKAKGLSEWMPDEQVTVVGKRAERARQFINWVLLSPSIDNHPVFRQVWMVSAGTALFLIIIVVGLMGASVLLARRRDVSFGVDIVPILYKTIILIAYVAFSYLIVLSLIQLTDLMMGFFIKTLGGDQLFKIFFVDQSPNAANQFYSSEEGYRNFVGYRRTGAMYSESARTSLFMIDLTSFTYFALGIMLLIRKVFLWFLLIVAPFLAILMPFIFIRNIGWIWIGTFFQWAFYGPLVALFLGALAKIWSVGIPFVFNFSRAKVSCEPGIFSRSGPNTCAAGKEATEGIVYPLAINILWGGPAQRPDGLGKALTGNVTGAPANTASYVDTFAEYVISLIMLWAVIMLPWWLLRIFRDYCCDGIYAMRNILMQMMNNGGMTPTPSAPTPVVTPVRTDTTREMNKELASRIERTVNEKVSALENIKTVQTERIAQKLDVHTQSLKDIAQFETKSERREYFNALSEHLRNPMSAENATDRAAFVKIKTEISDRAVRGDELASRILAATTASSVQVNEHIQQIAQTRPSITTVNQSLAHSINIHLDHIETILNTWSKTMLAQTQQIAAVAKSVSASESAVQQVVATLPEASRNQTYSQFIEKISEKSSLSKEKTSETIREIVKASHANEAITQSIATASNTSPSTVKKVLESVEKKVEKPDTVTQAVYKNVRENAALVNAVAQRANVKPEQVTAVLTNPEGAKPEKEVKAVLDAVPAVAQRERVIDSVAQVQKVSVDEARKSVEKTTLELKAKVGQSKAEDLIDERDTLSIEEYEEIKEMWVHHYLHSEVPVTQVIKTREDWISQDRVTLENTLNKIIAENEEVRAEGLKLVSDSIPFFMLADMSIQDIAVYLKAKLAAAKEAQQMLERESAVKTKLEEKMSEEVVYNKKQEPAANTQTMQEKMEMPIDDSVESGTKKSQ